MGYAWKGLAWKTFTWKTLSWGSRTQPWAWKEFAWSDNIWKEYSWGNPLEPSTPVIIPSSGGGGNGTADYPQSAWSMWDDPIITKDNYKLLRQEDQEMFEILEILTLSGMI
jgi:hypothetical protein